MYAEMECLLLQYVLRLKRKFHRGRLENGEFSHDVGATLLQETLSLTQIPVSICSLFTGIGEIKGTHGVPKTPKSICGWGVRTAQPH